MESIFLITPEIDPEKGGIQNWMYYLEKLFKNKNYKFEHYAYKEDNFFKILISYFNNVYFLANWKMSLFLLPILLFTKRKIFVFVHGNDILALNKLEKFLFKFLIKRKNTFFIANSEAIGDLFTDISKRKIDYVQHPFMEIKGDIKFSKENKENIFFTLTRLVKRKNIGNVLRALRELKNDGIQFKYYIGGSGQEYDNLKKLIIKLGLDDDVFLLGHIGEEEKKHYFQKANYFLLPSIFDEKDGSLEGYGIVFIEANAYGIPVLSGNTGGMPEAVINKITGIHCDGTVEDIYEKLKILINMRFDRKIILHHAQKHDYLNQSDFMNFVEKKIYE